MMAPTHVASGLAAVVVFGRVVGVTPDAVELLAFIVGSLAPDMDGHGVITRPGSILRRFFGRGFVEILDVMAQALSAVLKRCFGHRGFIHSPLLACSIIVLSVYLGHEWLVWFGGGYAVHLLGDAMTPMGIPALSPFSTRRIAIGSIRTGSTTEYVMAGLLVLFTCGFGWGLLPEDVKLTHAALFTHLVGR